MQVIMQRLLPIACTRWGRLLLLKVEYHMLNPRHVLGDIRKDRVLIACVHMVDEIDVTQFVQDSHNVPQSVSLNH